MIELRKQIQLQREQLKQMAIQKIKFQERHSRILEDLQSCEHVEKRRHDVALETEQALIKAKEDINGLKKELVFANNNRRDLETALLGQKEQTEMLSRELMTLRDQLAPRGPPTISEAF